MKGKLEYIKFLPGGNMTALVLDKNYGDEQRKIINDEILEKDKEIEQVGFIYQNEYKLDMAGGEFCGNALRSAIMYYLKDKKGNIEILVNNKFKILGGIDENNNVWCEIPLLKNEKQIIEKDNGIYLVKLDGIVFIVLDSLRSKEILNDRVDLKEYTLSLIYQYRLNNEEACGIILIEENENIKITPIVWVRKINTLFEESACGSGTAATAMVKTYIEEKNKILKIEQPSKKIIEVYTTYENKKITKVVISGKVESTLKIIK